MKTDKAGLYKDESGCIYNDSGGLAEAKALKERRLRSLRNEERIDELEHKIDDLNSKFDTIISLLQSK